MASAGTFDPCCAKAADIFHHLTENFGFQIEGIARVAERYPTLTLVVAHTLFPSQDSDNDCRLELIKHLKKENIFFDIPNLQASKGNTARLE